MIKALKLATALNVILLLGAGYSAASAEGLKVVSSFTVISDFAKNVGGDKVSTDDAGRPGRGRACL